MVLDLQLRLGGSPGGNLFVPAVAVRRAVPGPLQGQDGGGRLARPRGGQRAGGRLQTVDEYVGVVLRVAQFVLHRPQPPLEQRQPAVHEVRQRQQGLHRSPAGRVPAAGLRRYGPQLGHLPDLRGEPVAPLAQPVQPVLGLLQLQSQGGQFAVLPGSGGPHRPYVGHPQSGRTGDDPAAQRVVVQGDRQPLHPDTYSRVWSRRETGRQGAAGAPEAHGPDGVHHHGLQDRIQHGFRCRLRHGLPAGSRTRTAARDRLVRHTAPHAPRPTGDRTIAAGRGGAGDVAADPGRSALPAPPDSAPSGGRSSADLRRGTLHPRSRRYASNSAAPASIARPRADSRPCQSCSAASSGSSPPAVRTRSISGAIRSSG